MITQSPVKVWRNQKKVTAVLGKKGVVISWTIIRTPPVGFEDQAPYAVALVALDEVNFVGQIVDCDIEKVHKGMKVKAVLRRVKTPGKEGIIPYGVKFKPINQLT